MRDNLAIHGGPRTVPEGLKKRWPEITQADKDAVMAVLDRGVLTGSVHGPEAEALEKEWAAFNSIKHALAFNSGTAAIHTALFAAGVQPGDEVITSAFSFSGSFQPILQQSAIPIFVDIDPRTYNIDVSQIEARITDRTTVLLPVHIHGLPADMDKILALAKKYNLIVVEDACQAHGATYKGQMAGTIGDMGCFSLNQTKNLSGGEGGFMITANDAFADRAKMLRTFGERVGEEQEKFRPYYCHTLGYNYRLQELPAAFARSQLKRLPRYNAIAQRNGQYLSQELGKIKGLIPPHVPADRTTIYHKYRLRFDPDGLGVKGPAVEFRDKLLEALNAEGVTVALWHYTPLPAFPIFRNLDIGYGNGYPWRAPFYNREIRYEPADYPEAVRLLETSLVVNDERYSIFIQDMELMECYVAAFRKVFDNLDELLG
jgi:dTDP-4-amino-4,6-dideoxygalactose transaminase